MSDCNCKNILNLQPQCNATINVQPHCPTVLNIEASGSGTGNYDHNKLYNRELPDQHPIEAITGLEEALRRADTFVFEQAIASDTWEIEHNLNKHPSVTVVDSAGTVFYPAVQYIDENNIIITMNGATTGKAYLN